LVEIGAIGRNRDRVGNSYIYTLLALPEYTVAGAAIIAGGAAINSPPLRHGVPQYKNKVQKKRGIGRVSVLPKSSGVPKGKAPVASHDNGNGALPRLTDAMRVSAERELDRVERAINNLEPEAHMSEKDVLSNIERLRLKQLRVRRKELKARLDLVD
jgi:hypothetical protein